VAARNRSIAKSNDLIGNEPSTFPLTNFNTNNEHFQTNADVYSVYTRPKHYLHKTIANTSCFQKSAYYAGIRMFSNLLCDLESLMNEKAQFKMALKRYLNTHSFYFVDEYLLFKNDASV
jgi:hypothetical protein